MPLAPAMGPVSIENILISSSVHRLGVGPKFGFNRQEADSRREFLPATRRYKALASLLLYSAHTY